jgi:hypothetical protein
MTVHIWTWIAEVKGLLALGMPVGAFSFEIDCDGIPDHTTEVFKRVHLDVAWDAAIQVLRAETLANGVNANRARNPIAYHLSSYWTYEALQEILQAILNSMSVIRCNFDIGIPVNYKTLLDLGRWSQLKYVLFCSDRREARIGPIQPLSGWYGLRRKDLILERTTSYSIHHNSIGDWTCGLRSLTDDTHKANLRAPLRTAHTRVRRRLRHVNIE